MPVVIKIGPEANAKKVRLEIDARQALNGDVMIFDHGDIDIVLSTAKNKIIAFPKDTMNDLVYGAQNRLMSHLMKMIKMLYREICMNIKWDVKHTKNLLAKLFFKL